MTTQARRTLQWTALVVLALGAGWAGLRFGSGLRAKQAPLVEAPQFPFKPGDAMPEVSLADSLGVEAGSRERVAGCQGAVVLFLDPHCDGCTAMAVRWQSAIEQGAVAPEHVFAITRDTPAVNQGYREEHALSYAVYQDAASAFLKQHGVVTYPMEMVVSADGTIQSLSSDSKTPVDGESVRALLSR